MGVDYGYFSSMDVVNISGAIVAETSTFDYTKKVTSIKISYQFQKLVRLICLFLKIRNTKRPNSRSKLKGF